MADSDIYDRLALPTPFDIGEINCYLVGRTLIDPGPDSDETWETLLQHLDERELTVDDIQQVVLTHAHPDHFGMANRVAAAGASVIATATTAEIVGDFGAKLQREMEYFEPFLINHGLETELATAGTRLSEFFLEYTEDVDVDHICADGEIIPTEAASLRVEETSGHALSEAILNIEPGGTTAFVGDHVLDPMTPTPFLEPPISAEADRPRMLVRYLRSLEALSERSFDRFLPGHRDNITRPNRRINHILQFRRRRSDRLEAMMDGTTTAAELMHSMFEDIAVGQVFIGMSEVIGHLDLLEAEGRIKRFARNDRILYRPVQ